MAKKKLSTASEPSPKSSGSNGLGALFEDLLDLDELKGVTIKRIYEPFRGVLTGSIALDYVLGGGLGIPRGQITQIDGMPGTGKTTLELLIAITSISEQLKVAVIPTEGRWNQAYAKNSGGGEPGKDYFLGEPNTAEDALNLLVYLAENDFDLCIIDSIIGLPTRTQFTNELGEKTYAPLAAVLSDFFKMRINKLRNSNMAVVFSNQLRARIGQMYGDPKGRPGGYALEFYTSVGLHLDEPTAKEFEYPPGSKDDKGKLKDEAEPIGMTITGKTWKNSICSPRRRLELPIRFSGGRLTIDREGELADYGKRFEVLRSKSGTPITGGANWCYQGEVIGASRQETKTYLREHREAALEIESAVRAAMIAKG